MDIVASVARAYESNDGVGRTDNITIIVRANYYKQPLDDAHFLALKSIWILLRV